GRSPLLRLSPVRNRPALKARAQWRKAPERLPQAEAPARIAGTAQTTIPRRSPARRRALCRLRPPDVGASLSPAAATFRSRREPGGATATSRLAPEGKRPERPH